MTVHLVVLIHIYIESKYVLPNGKTIALFASDSSLNRVNHAIFELAILEVLTALISPYNRYPEN